jgi:hypothetical protein
MDYASKIRNIIKLAVANLYSRESKKPSRNGHHKNHSLQQGYSIWQAEMLNSEEYYLSL